MMSHRASLAARGAVVLSQEIACDGFDPSCRVRIQTHVHDDHLGDFASSKGTGDIVCTAPTRDLLIAAMNADLAYRRNLRALPLNTAEDLDSGSKILLVDAAHIAGSAQVAVTHGDGYRTGYSGDFAWPLREVIEVDELVLDATYGSPDSVRKYSQQEAESRFVEEVLGRLKSGAVVVYAHRGTLQRAIALLDGVTQMPLLGSPLQCAESEVYARHGHNQATLLDSTSPEGLEAMGSGRYVLFSGKGDRRVDLQWHEHKIVLSAYMAPRSDPFLEYSERSCRVALSNHADFTGTLEYVEAVNPSVVLTDGSRSRHAEVLATEIVARLGIHAEPIYPTTTQVWV
jgi:putative mRNA 3-end processing factor